MRNVYIWKKGEEVIIRILREFILEGICKSDDYFYFLYVVYFVVIVILR